MSQRPKRRRVFRRLLREHAWFLAWYAYHLAPGDEALQDDLVQEGLFALWRVDVGRFRSAHNRRAFARGVIRKSMWNYLRRQHPSLAARMVRIGETA